MNNYSSVNDYYRTRESRFGYPLVLRGAKHFGLYTKQMSMWSFDRALRNMEDALAESLSLPPGSRVLDAGSGMGAVATRLVEKFGLIITGIDLLDFNVRSATRSAIRRGIDGRATFALMDYSETEFQADSFDGVYTMETLVHASDHEKVLNEFFRVLKPGGVLVNIEYARDREENMSLSARRAFEDVNRYASMPAFDKFYYGALERDLESAGFHVERVEDVTEGILPMLRAFSMLAALPYAILRRIKDPKSIVNMMSAVEFWKYRQHFKFNIYISRKPTPPSQSVTGGQIAPNEHD